MRMSTFGRITALSLDGSWMLHHNRLMKHRYLNQHNALWLSIQMLVLWALASPPIAKPWYDSLLFKPWMTGGDPTITSIAGVPKQNLTITTKSGARLNAWYFRVAEAKKTLLVSQGNGGAMADRKLLIESFLPYHVSLLEYDYAGYGTSTGKTSLDQILQDGDSVYDYLVNDLKVDPKSIVVVGESIGSGVACHIASHRGCNSVILLSPFCSLMRLAKSKLPWLNLYPASWFPYVDIDNRTALKDFQNPVLILYGPQDLTIPPSEAIELSRLCHTCSLVEIPGRGHLLYYPPTSEYKSALITFLSGRQKCN